MLYFDERKGRVMYLISIYFDEKTGKRIQGYINRVAEHSDNHFMLDEKVPPHITLSAFETRDVEPVIDKLSRAVKNMEKGRVQWATVGQFFPYVIFLAPVLNEYLHGLSQRVYDSLSKIEDVSISPFYQPFQWLPHTTVGKTLSKEQMRKAFEVLQNSFGVFEGEVVEIGLAKTNPHRDIVRWKLD